MVIYMGQATIETSFMIGGVIKNHIIAFFIPFSLTLYQAYKYRVNFSDSIYRKVFLIALIWIIAVIIKFHIGYGNNRVIMCFFFLLYSISVAFVHIKIYGKKLFLICECILYYIALLSIFLWSLANLFLAYLNPFFRSLPLADMSVYGNHLCYLYTWMDPLKGQIYNGIIRNAGCSWEPGRFAIMLCIAVCINILNNGVTFRNNKKLVVFLIAVLTTQSTTGVSIIIILFLLYFLNFKKTSNIVGFIFAFLIALYASFNLSFLGEKVEKQTDFSEVFFKIEKEMKASDERLEEGEYWGSLERFPAIYFESYNVANDPILGYTPDKQYSYFYNNISTHFELTGGLLKLLGFYGIPLGLLLYFLLFKSSKEIAGLFDQKGGRRYLFFTCVVLSSVSYVTFGIPIITAIYFYSIFSNR